MIYSETPKSPSPSPPPETQETDQAEEIFRCIFCKIGQEKTVAQEIRCCSLGDPCYPQYVKPIRRKGIWNDELFPLFPGYVFIRGNAPEQAIQRFSHVIRLLRYDTGNSVLYGTDREFAKVLWREKGLIRKMEAVREGSFIRVVDPLLLDMRGTVLKVNPRKHIALVEIAISGQVRHIWLGLNILETT